MTTPPPARVRTDIASFHLDRQPHASAPTQVGAGVRGDTTNLILCAPQSGFSASTRPLFVWQLPRGAATRVHFTLLNAAGDVLYETDISGTRLLYPQDAPPLSPGKTYSWHVSGRALDKQPTFASFEILDQTKQQRIASELALTADPLSAAQVYLRNEVWYDAIATLLNSMDNPASRKLLDRQLQELYAAVVPACAAP